MSRYFLDPDFQPNEPSHDLAFCGNTLERLSEERSEDDIPRALDNDDTRALGIVRGRALIDFRTGTPVGLHSLDVLSEFAPKQDLAILLGYDAEAPRLAMPLSLNPDDENLDLPDDVQAALETQQDDGASVN